MSALRIVHAIRSDGYSGVERYVLRVAAAQAGAGHDVHVIGGDPAHMRGPLSAAGIGHTAAARTFEVIRALNRQRAGADVVNTHMTAADLAAVTALRARRRGPVVVSTRHFASRRGRVGPIPLDRVVSGTVDSELAISEAVAAAIGRPSTVVPSGLAPREPSNAIRTTVVLIAQRLQPEKETQLALDAFARSELAPQGWELWIAGIGPERSGLEVKARDLSIASSVNFLGYRADLSALMDECGILLAPCSIEGLGLSVLEAMQSGLPVVAARGGGHVELLDGLDTRALFTAGDSDAAARVLRSLAGDEAGRTALGAAEQARQRDHYTIDSQVRGTDAVYRAAIAARRRRT